MLFRSNASAAMQAMEQGLAASLNQASIEFSDADSVMGDGEEIREVLATEELPAVSIARAEMEDITQQESTGKMQESEQAPIEATDQPHPEADNDSQQSH